MWIRTRQTTHAQMRKTRSFTTMRKAQQRLARSNVTSAKLGSHSSQQHFNRHVVPSTYHHDAIHAQKLSFDKVRNSQIGRDSGGKGLGGSSPTLSVIRITMRWSLKTRAQAYSEKSLRLSRTTIRRRHNVGSASAHNNRGLRHGSVSNTIPRHEQWPCRGLG